MDTKALLEAHHYDLSSPALQPYANNIAVVMPCLEKDVSQILHCGDRILDDYDVAVFVLQQNPSYLWRFSIRIQTHSDIVSLVGKQLKDLEKEGKITFSLSLRHQANIAKSEGLRRNALCSML